MCGPLLVSEADKLGVDASMDSSRDGVAWLTFQAHNLKIAGSSPAPAIMYCEVFTL